MVSENSLLCSNPTSRATNLSLGGFSPTKEVREITISGVVSTVVSVIGLPFKYIANLYNANLAKYYIGKMCACASKIASRQTLSNTKEKNAPQVKDYDQMKKKIGTIFSENPKLEDKYGGRLQLADARVTLYGRCLADPKAQDVIDAHNLRMFT